MKTKSTNRRQLVCLVTVGVILLFLVVGALTFNKLWYGVWGFPFAKGKAIAIIKTIPTSGVENPDRSEKYYKIYQNGSKEETAFTEHHIDTFYLNDCISSYLDNGETKRKVTGECHVAGTRISEGWSDMNENGEYTHHFYLDDEGNEYAVFPEISDTQMQAIKNQLAAKLARLDDNFYTTIYRDNTTIFVVNHTDSVWVSGDELYIYDQNTNNLRFIGQLCVDQEIVAGVFTAY